MGGCQNDGSFLGTLNIRCRIIIGTQKGTIILTTTHMPPSSSCSSSCSPAPVADPRVEPPGIANQRVKDERRGWCEQSPSLA